MSCPKQLSYPNNYHGNISIRKIPSVLIKFDFRLLFFLYLAPASGGSAKISEGYPFDHLNFIKIMKRVWAVDRKRCVYEL